MVNGGDAGDASAPLDLTHLPALGNDVHQSFSGIPFENLGCTVSRVVVDHNDEVNSGVEVESEVRVNNVRLVSDEKRLDEQHVEVLPTRHD